MSSSDDDAPLLKASRPGALDPGVSIRFGPVDDEDVDMKDAANGVNGHTAGKRRARVSAGKQSYAEAESSEDEEPLVCTDYFPT